jgi:hypothetical protein
MQHLTFCSSAAKWERVIFEVLPPSSVSTNSLIGETDSAEDRLSTRRSADNDDAIRVSIIQDEEGN